MEDRDYWDRLANDPLYEPVRALVCATAKDAEDRPGAPCADDFLAAKLRNDRSLTDRFWREARFVLGALTFERCLIGGAPDERRDARLLNWLWTHLTAPTWRVAAHLPGNDLPGIDQDDLDLAGCEMAAVMAETREALGGWLGGFSDTLGDRIVAEIDRRVLGPFVGAGDKPGGQPWWSVNVHNNWTGVCAGSILCACESLAAQGHPRPAARAKAIELINAYLHRGFTPDGECDEGVSYWRYGVSIMCMGLSRLPVEEIEREIDTDRLRAVAAYPGRVHLFGQTFFSTNDGSMRCDAGPDFVPWLAAVTGDPFLQRWTGTVSFEHVRCFPLLVRAVRGLELDAGVIGPERPVEHEPSRMLSDQQGVILQRDTAAGPMIVSLTGGSNNESHNHNDLGHVTVVVDRQTVMPDLGAPWYTPDFFGPARYTYLSASSEGHSVPVIAGQAQHVGHEAKGEVLDWSADAQRLSLELSSAYPPRAGLTRWVRELASMDSAPGYRLTDTFQTAAPGTAVRQVFWSCVEPVAIDGHTLRLGTAVLTLPAEASEGERAVEAVSGDEHRLRDFGGQTLWRITVEAVTDHEGRLEQVTTIVAPG